MKNKGADAKALIFTHTHTHTHTHTLFLTHSFLYSTGSRAFSTKSSASRKAAPLLVGVAAAGAAGYGAYKVWSSNPLVLEKAMKTVQEAVPTASVSAAAPAQAQPSVSLLLGWQGKDHAVCMFIVIIRFTHKAKTMQSICSLSLLGLLTRQRPCSLYVQCHY